MKVLFAADMVPMPSNEALFSQGNMEELLGDGILSEIEGHDFFVFNLETPLCDKLTPIDKYGINLSARTSTVRAIKRMNPALICLANNHILDQGPEGLSETVNTLQSNKLNYIGAGMNITEAQKPGILEKDSIKIGVYNCAEHEFSIAGNDSAGANPYDPLHSFDQVQDLKKECDYVVVVYHGGKEHYRYPSPGLRKTCRHFVEKGADVVLCQHSHCIGCKEEYLKGTIVYGQGNFLFDDNDNEFWNTSILVGIDFTKERKEVRYIPIKKDGCRVRIADDGGESIIDEFNKRSEEIKKDGFIEDQYRLFTKKSFCGYVATISGKKFYLRLFNKILGGRLYKNYYKHDALLALYNYMNCEAHQELLTEALRIESKKD